MIHIAATIKGERDLPPFTRVFEYGTGDEEIFFSSAAMIHEKLRSSMKINVNEALVIYSVYLAKAIRAGKKDSTLQEEGTKILSADNVMIGVPETLRVITFEARIDSLHARKIKFNKPIPSGKYALTS